MFTRKPLWMLTSEDASEGGEETEAPEAEETTESDAAEPDTDSGESGGDSADGEDEKEAFDAERALKKIRKANAEAKAQRERAKKAEEKAKGLEPAVRDAALQRVARRLELPDTPEVDEFLSRLRGETADELAEDAERLLALMSPKKSTSTKPTPRLRGGGEPDEEPTPDAEKVVASLPRF